MRCTYRAEGRSEPSAFKEDKSMDGVLGDFKKRQHISELCKHTAYKSKSGLFQDAKYIIHKKPEGARKRLISALPKRTQQPPE